MPSFRLPTFNLSVAIWTGPAIPPVGAPRLITVGNLAPGRRVFLGWNGLDGTHTLNSPNSTLTLLLPKLTDVRWDQQGVPPDILEVPHGSGRFYQCQCVDDIGKGFSNEHRFAFLAAVGVWPVPLP